MTRKHMERKIKCRVCEKEITVFTKRHSGCRYFPKRYQSSRSTLFVTTESEEGVLFKTGEKLSYTGVWFCNDCWKEIIDYVNKKNGRK